MRSTNLRSKFNLYRNQVVRSGLLFLLLILMAGKSAAQYTERTTPMVNPNYDDRKKVTYGFTIGIHWSKYKMNYDDVFTTVDYDTVHSIMPRTSPGFSLGFIINLRAADLLDLRLMPKVSFYEFRMDYNFTNNSTTTPLVEATVVEFPLLAKFKSIRRGNGRMYVVGGVSPGFEASGKSDVEDRTDNLLVNSFYTSLEIGFGLDLYFPLFKFSPEIRYSYGLPNMLANESNRFNDPVSRLRTHVVTFYFLFQ